MQNIIIWSYKLKSFQSTGAVFGSYVEPLPEERKNKRRREMEWVAAWLYKLSGWVGSAKQYGANGRTLEASIYFSDSC